MSLFLKISSITTLAVGLQLALCSTVFISKAAATPHPVDSAPIIAPDVKPGTGLKGDDYEPPPSEPPRSTQGSGTR